MNAVVYDSYGPSEVLRLKDVAKPSPKDNEVLVRVHAASVNAADWRMMRADPFLVRLYAGLVKPTKFQTLGADIAGRVEEQSTLRPDPWGERESLDFRLQASSHLHGRLCHGRGQHRAALSSPVAGALDLPRRAAKDRISDFGAEPEGFAVHQGPSGIRKDKARDRSALPAERGHRGGPLRRSRTRNRESRDHVGARRMTGSGMQRSRIARWAWLTWALP